MGFHFRRKAWEAARLSGLRDCYGRHEEVHRSSCARARDFGIPHGQGNWVDNSTDPKVCEAAKAYSAALTALTESQAKAFENAVPTARVVRLRGAHHYVFLSNEADAPREMRPFLSAVADEWPRFTIRMSRRHAARVPRNGVPIGRVVGNWLNCYAWQTDVSLSDQQSCALRFQPVRRCS